MEVRRDQAFQPVGSELRDTDVIACAVFWIMQTSQARYVQQNVRETYMLCREKRGLDW